MRVPRNRSPGPLDLDALHGKHMPRRARSFLTRPAPREKIGPRNGGTLLAGIRSRLTYANVMATIAVFIALGGVAWAAATINGRDVIDESLTGRDIRDHSRVDNCPDGSARFGVDFCVRVANLGLNRGDAANFCADVNMRLPSFAEGTTLARNFEIPNVGDSELFWTDEFWTEFDNSLGFEVGMTLAVFGNGQSSRQKTSITSPETVCLAVPTN